MNLLGARVIQDANALEATAERLFPASRHRSARILKKLIRRHGSEFRMRPIALHDISTDTYIVHPAIYREFQREIAAKMDHQLRTTLMGDRLFA